MEAEDGEGPRPLSTNTGGDSTPSPPSTTAHVFHTYVRIHTVLTTYFIIVAVMLGASLSITAVTANNDWHAHQDRATAVANNLAGYVDDQLGSLFAAVGLLQGFVAAGAPLSIPDYSGGMNASQRVWVALTPGTPGALTLPAYQIVRTGIDSLVTGLWDAYLQPGGINAYTRFGFNPNGIDYMLGNSNYLNDEYSLMINSSRAVLRGPVPSVVRQQHIYISIRTPIFNVPYSRLNHDPRAVDPQTGRHPNVRHLWGASQMLWDLHDFCNLSDIRTKPGTHYEYLFESLPTDMPDRIVRPAYMVIDNTTHTSRFSRDYVTGCTENSHFAGLMCFRVIPSSGRWDGANRGARMGVAALLSIFAPMAALVLLVGIARAFVGPRPDPLANLPRTVPFHAVCIDLANSHDMWCEMPFVMSEVTSIFSNYLVECAAEHSVHIVLRLGCTAVVISAERANIVSFTEAMCAWAYSYEWSAHVWLHREDATIQFCFVLHTCTNADIDINDDGSTCEVGGRDIQTLLLLRTAAIPRHIICTGQFLGLDDDGKSSSGKDSSGKGSSQKGSKGSNSAKGSTRAPTSDDPRALSKTASATRESLELQAMRGNCRELGFCEMPVVTEHSIELLHVHGFLVPSAATEQRKLADVADTLPDSVWLEWHRKKGPDDRMFSPVENPLAGLTGGDHPSSELRQSSGTGFSQSRMLSISMGSRSLTAAHENNERADPSLTGCAVDLADAAKIAQLLVISSARTPTDMPGSGLQRLRVGRHVRVVLPHRVQNRVRTDRPEIPRRHPGSCLRQHRHLAASRFARPRRPLRPREPAAVRDRGA
jgi:hypothetical protein